MTSRTFEWHPAKLLQEKECSPEFALLVLNQPLKNGNDLRRLWNNCTLLHDSLFVFFEKSYIHTYIHAEHWLTVRQASLRVAADGGANRLHDLSSFRGKFVR